MGRAVIDRAATVRLHSSPVIDAVLRLYPRLRFVIYFATPD